MNHRIGRVQDFLIREKLDLLIVDHLVDLIYLTEVDLSIGRLIIEPDSATLFVDARYFEMCQKRATVTVKQIERYGQEPFDFKDKRVGFDGANTSYQVYNQLKERVGEGLVPLDQPIRDFRQVKSVEELAILGQAGRLAMRGYDYLLNLIKEGVSDEALALELEIFWRKEGGQKLAFEAIIAVGENSSQPHYHPGKRVLKHGEPVLIDIGVVSGHYHSDMTRVVFCGAVDKKIEEIYDVVYRAQKMALELCRPGVLVGEVDRAARRVIDEAGYGDYFPHSLGHGVGLEIHELPFLKSTSPYGEVKLAEGMVITIEPGIYLPKVGGVRLEEMIAITSDGYENLLGTPVASSAPIL